jgi:hypothetical protein
VADGAEGEVDHGSARTYPGTSAVIHTDLAIS